MVTTFLSSPLLIQVILPFVILFTVVYSILQKTKILGDNKTLNLVIALALSLISVSFANPTNIITKIIPIFAIAIVSVLVLLIVFAFAEGKEKFELSNGVKYAIWGAVGFAILATILWASGIWTYITNKSNSELLWNIVFFIVIAAVIGVAAAGGSGGDKKK